MSVDLAALTSVNASLWLTCKIDPIRQSDVTRVAQRIFAGRVRYEDIFEATNVPWWFVGIVHYREADLSFGLSIAQGDRFDRVSTHVPRGRGPFPSWREAALDALVKCPPYTARWTDWSMGGALTAFEAYNGFGYEQFHHENSPYNWGATNHEERGKYVADGKYSPAAWDNQIGSAALMKAVFAIEQGASV
jgi:lysozyme family protein